MPPSSFLGNLPHVDSVCEVIGVWGVALVRNRNMAGLYQGYHSFPNKAGSIEIFWRADDRCWWSRGPGRPPEGAPIRTIPNKHRSLSQRERRCDANPAS